MNRKKHTRFFIHIIYIIIISYILTQRSSKIYKIKVMRRFTNDLRHILIWTELPGVSRDGQDEFIGRRCRKQNCYFTRNRTLFSDIRYFDAIVFNLKQVSQGPHDLPKLRASHQKYILAANLSSDSYPVCDPVYDEFFNWTWTYKINSTIPYKFFTVKTIYGQELDGVIHWRLNQKKLEKYRQKQLDTKTKAAAIFLNKCKSRSNREGFINALQKELAKYNQTIDIYGDCGPLKCRRKTMKSCYYRLRHMYFFYLALEDSIAPNYITDEILHAYLNDVVPIVYGGAVYEEYLPAFSYIDARQRNITELAKHMHALMSNRQLYYDMFSWKKHYTFETSSKLDPCKLCDTLNDPLYLEYHNTFSRFREWWNLNYYYRCQVE